MLSSKNLELSSPILTQSLNKETSDIWKHFENCCQYDHFQKHKEYIDPIVESCRKSLDLFKEESNSNKLIIRRFDEVLLDKASKFDLDNLKIQFKDYVLVQDYFEYK